MSIFRRHDTEGLPSIVTTNVAQRKPVFRSPEACRLLIDTMYATRRDPGFQLLAFSIMPDHLHLVLVSDVLPCVMQLIKGRFARAHNQALGRSGPVWQSRYHERTLGSEAALSSALEYVHLNAVNAALADREEDYPWSSACGRFETDLDQYLGGSSG